MTAKPKSAAYTAAQKVWLIELSERDPSLSTAELGHRLAQNMNDDRCRDLVQFEPPVYGMDICNQIDEVCRKINIQTLQKKKEVDITTAWSRM